MQRVYQHKNRRKYSLNIYIVLVTKYRRKLLVNGIDYFVKRTCMSLAEQNPWNIITMGTDSDHIHLLPEYDTTTKVCDMIRILK